MPVKIRRQPRFEIPAYRLPEKARGAGASDKLSALLATCSEGKNVGRRNWLFRKRQTRTCFKESTQDPACERLLDFNCLNRTLLVRTIKQ